jgi:hypothetical protein
MGRRSRLIGTRVVIALMLVKGTYPVNISSLSCEPLPVSQSSPASFRHLKKREMNNGGGRVTLMDSIKVLKVPPSSEYWYQKNLLVCHFPTPSRPWRRVELRCRNPNGRQYMNTHHPLLWGVIKIKFRMGQGRRI